MHADHLQDTDNTAARLHSMSSLFTLLAPFKRTLRVSSIWIRARQPELILLLMGGSCRDQIRLLCACMANATSG